MNEPLFEVSAACAEVKVIEPRATTFIGSVPGVPGLVIATPLIVEVVESVASSEHVAPGITMLRVLLSKVEVGFTNAAALALIVRVPPQVAVPLNPNTMFPPEEALDRQVNPVVPVLNTQLLGLDEIDDAAEVIDTVGSTSVLEIVDVVAITGAVGAAFVTVIVYVLVVVRSAPVTTTVIVLTPSLRAHDEP